MLDAKPTSGLSFPSCASHGVNVGFVYDNLSTHDAYTQWTVRQLMFSFIFLSLVYIVIGPITLVLTCYIVWVGDTITLKEREHAINERDYVSISHGFGRIGLYLLVSLRTNIANHGSVTYTNRGFGWFGA